MVWQKVKKIVKSQKSPDKLVTIKNFLGNFCSSAKKLLVTKKENFINIIKFYKYYYKNYNFIPLMLLVLITFLSIFLIPFLVLVVLPFLKGKRLLTTARFIKWGILILKTILIYLSPELGIVETTNIYFYGPAFVINIK